ncbi:phosphoribosylformylglycinamidine cyclo-ligase [Enterococcus hermanniensis]|uniref:Phosphoribosylformylglycinamidine cyclo-ligase n=1 Tax=Enterococcus hermanniensis TaxID=249189 RepID=A0A1L8TL04_9ENTE|nr:phosphoribosylformylglycinamidine cyclo-ligase [Enterococcus hermanniensis]OJG45015.1 phosphoribosylformylglycinamidine cyclo-ligase [Enterococcus hermanniensis]
MANAYSKAGVDVDAGYEVVERIKKHVKKTTRLGMMGAIGGFGGCFDLSEFKLKQPVLVSGTDGVGTKLMVAIEADKHDTIGIDCVAMCVNDIVAQGAEPLYFLDYIATGKTIPTRLEQVVAGVAEGCVQAGAALIGGETAEMPGMYTGNDYDLAGFSVGLAEKEQLITGDTIQTGDLLIGLPSSGIHSNGYSLVRKIFFEKQKFSIVEELPELNRPLGEELLEPTRIYVAAVLPLIKQNLINGIAHITGGGFVENLPRMLPEKYACEIDLDTWPILPIFKALEKYGEITELEMYEIFNMGIGMVIAVSPEKLATVKADLAKRGESYYTIGRIVDKQASSITFNEAIR